MKKSHFFILIVSVGLYGCKNPMNYINDYSINPIIGDISYAEKFGKLPDESVDEDLRITTHLSYVEDLLRKKNTSHLSDEMKKKRSQALDLLHDYWTSGVFPRNYDYLNERKPCFIDETGNICAVGYLVEQTAGREVAEKINSIFKYDKVYDMEDQEVLAWVEQSGLTLEECAMIQPTYGGGGGYHTPGIWVDYGISSGVLGGANIALNTINAIHINNESSNRTIPLIGLATGLGQITLGAFNVSWLHTDATRSLSYLNIGLGTSTVMMSGYNLLAQRKRLRKSQATSWNFYSYPLSNSAMVYGIGFNKRF